MRVDYLVTFCALLSLALSASAVAQVTDQHSVEGILAAMQSSLTDEAIAKAREFDDQMLAGGSADDQRVYLVTDERSRKVNAIVGKLIAVTGQDPKAWVVRVLDTTPPTNNAFVVGGQYVYVFTGFLAAAQSDDEIAFVLGHELGHSLLKHLERQEDDFTMRLARLASVIAALSGGKTAQQIGIFGEVLGADYSQQDEAEADALGVAITLRAGFDPLRGADFFTRDIQERAKAAPGSAISESDLQALRAGAVQAQNNCLKARSNLGIWPTQVDQDRVNLICAEAERKRVAFNRTNNEYYTAQTQAVLQRAVGSHPSEQSRVAALAATVDFLAGRRDIESLATYKTAHLVMTALQQSDSVLLEPPPQLAAAESKLASVSDRADLAAQLETLKKALDAGLISTEEYQSKRQELLDRL